MAMLWRSSYMIYLGIVGVAVLLLLISRAIVIGGWLHLLLGIILGVVIRNLRLHHQTIRLWPVLDSIIDWNSVEALLQPPTHPASHDPT